MMAYKEKTFPRILLIFLSVDLPLFMRRPMLYAMAQSSKKYGMTVVAVNRPLCPASTILRKKSNNAVSWISAIQIQLEADKNVMKQIGREIASEHIWENMTADLLDKIKPLL
jgi:hypothetical protein